MTTTPTTTGTTDGEVQREHIDVYLMHFAADATNWELEMLAEITSYIDDKGRDLAASREREARLEQTLRTIEESASRWIRKGLYTDGLVSVQGQLGSAIAALAETEEPR